MKGKDDHKEAPKRRDFLKLIGLGGVAGATVLASGGAAPAQAKEPEKRSAGYRETAHVRKYYETARF
jgi:hypothetical protein